MVYTLERTTLQTTGLSSLATNKSESYTQKCGREREKKKRENARQGEAPWRSYIKYSRVRLSPFSPPLKSVRLYISLLARRSWWRRKERERDPRARHTHTTGGFVGDKRPLMRCRMLCPRAHCMSVYKKRMSDYIYVRTISRLRLLQAAALFFHLWCWSSPPSALRQTTMRSVNRTDSLSLSYSRMNILSISLVCILYESRRERETHTRRVLIIRDVPLHTRARERAFRETEYLWSRIRAMERNSIYLRGLSHTPCGCPESFKYNRENDYLCADWSYIGN